MTSEEQEGQLVGLSLFKAGHGAPQRIMSQGVALQIFCRALKLLCVGAEQACCGPRCSVYCCCVFCCCVLCYSLLCCGLARFELREQSLKMLKAAAG